MDTFRFLGVTCLVVFIVGAIVSILYDLGWIGADPENSELLNDRDRQTAEARQQAAARQRENAECTAARLHLQQFYAAHRQLLGNSCPPALIAAFIRSEMGDGLNASQLWTVCLNKITELLPSIASGRKGLIRLQQIDAEITACRQKIIQMERSARHLELVGEDVSFIEDEMHGQVDKIRQFEAQRHMLKTLDNGGTT